MKPFMCPNCNGQGPFLVLKVSDKIDRMGIADRDYMVVERETYYMCVSDEISTRGRGEPGGCRMVSTKEELTR